MTYNASGALACPLALPATFDGWLHVIPYRRQTGGISWRRPHGVTETYLAAISFVTVATAVRFAVDQFVIGSQFATYFLAVVCSTLCGGLCVGLFSVALSVPPAWFLFLAPQYHGLAGGELYSLATFMSAALPIVYLVGLLQSTRAMADDARLRAAVAEEHARSAAELRRWKHIFDNIAVGIAISDPKRNALITVNAAYAAMHGMPVDTAKGLSIFETYAPRERERIAQLAPSVDEDGFIDFEAYHLRKDGSIFPARVSITSVPLHDGIDPYRIVTVTDITAEHELQTRLVDVFENAAFGISIIEPVSNTISLANPAFAAAHATSVEAIQGTSVFDWCAPAERERITELKAIADRDGGIDYELEHVRKDGAVFPARVHITSVRTPDGAVRYRIATVQDIGREKQLRAELSQAQRLEAIGQLCAGVAHDFNNLLQATIAHLEMIEDDVVPESTRGYVDTAIRLAEEGGRLTQRLLSFARKQLLVPQEVHIRDFLEDFTRLLSHTLDPRIQIELKVAPGLATIFVDPTHLRTALLNLALNARDAMPSGGHLTLEARYADEESDTILLRTTDTGCGIAADDLTKVCEPFFSTKGLHGTGLGLPMVHGFVKQSGGDMHISSSPGEGTCVELSLPAHPRPERLLHGTPPASFDRGEPGVRLQGAPI